MVFNDTFNNISVCFRGFNNISVCFRGLFRLGLWCLIRIMVFNDTFNNISVSTILFRGLGLWCLTTLSTIG